MRTALFILALIGVVELALRGAGTIDFPLYDANNHIGYIPKPSQHGSFLRVNDWEFNSLSMGAPAFSPTTSVDNLLIGDSIVFGGNPYRSTDRLGPQLSAELHETVWPISAGSWGLLNELTWLHDHPDAVTQIDRIIFLLNGGDFDSPSSWACEATHPRQYPPSAILSLFRKYVWNWKPCGGVLPEFKVPHGNWETELHQILRTPALSNKPVAFFLYPDKKQTLIGNEELSKLDLQGEKLSKIVGDVRKTIFTIGRDPEWSSRLYRDGIHPTPEGNHVLANIISRHIDAGFDAKNSLP
jgi:hypothetical protein